MISTRVRTRMLAQQFMDVLREQNSIDSFGACSADYHSSHYWKVNKMYKILLSQALS